MDMQQAHIVAREQIALRLGAAIIESIELRATLGVSESELANARAMIEALQNPTVETSEEPAQ